MNWLEWFLLGLVIGALIGGFMAWAVFGTYGGGQTSG